MSTYARKYGATAEEMAAAIANAGKIRNQLLSGYGSFQSAGTGNSISGKSVTPETALSITAVFASVRVLAESVASLPMMVYRRQPDGGKAVATDHPLYRLLHDSPNRDQTSFEANEFRMASLALRGNSYSQIITNGRGDVREIHPLRPQFMRIERAASGKLVFDYQEPGAQRTFSQDEIWFTRGFSNDGVTGLSPIGVCREAIGYAITLTEHGSRMFANGAKIPGVLEVPGELSEVAYERLKKEFADKHEGAANAGRTILLEGGAKYAQIGMNASDAEFIAAQKLQIAEIARIFRVPLHMLNELENATFSNIEHQALEFVTHTLRPWLIRIEQSANRDLFGPQERGQYFVEFNLNALLRGDIKSRYEAYASGIVNGWLKRNEARAWENLNPEDGLDDFLVPLNMSSQKDATANDNPPIPDATKKPANSLTSVIKAVKIERARLSDSDFEKWAEDYFARTGHDGLEDVIALGADGAIRKWVGGQSDHVINVNITEPDKSGFKIQRNEDGTVTAVPIKET